ncbi:larval cuticle protein 65Ag1-like [Daphnia carinata]|uniref:larval cuticle protein 65Ag1-like n=1 Tax=Daphnia carinata TaxID=120202 RepID=UPI00257C15F2|nr:larval cuticle protein 65Ag1-like [Daphnia carinata]
MQNSISYIPTNRPTTTMKLFIIAAVLAVAAAAPSSYKAYEKDYKYPEITVTSQSDERNLDGSSKWNYAQSDYTTREESQQQKKFIVTKVDDYGKETKEDVYGNTNKGSSYWISPEGEKLTLTWAADEAGFQPAGAHLPVAPVHVYELPVAPVHEYELPVAPVHIPFNGKGYKIY